MVLLCQMKSIHTPCLSLSSAPLLFPPPSASPSGLGRRERAFRAKWLFVSPSSQTSSVGRELLPSVPPPFLRGLHPCNLALLPRHPSCLVHFSLHTPCFTCSVFSPPFLSLSHSCSLPFTLRMSLSVYLSSLHCSCFCLTLLPSLYPFLCLPDLHRPGLLSRPIHLSFPSPLVLSSHLFYPPLTHPAFASPILLSSRPLPSLQPSSLLLTLRGCPLRRMLPVLYFELFFLSAYPFPPFTLSAFAS